MIESVRRLLNIKRTVAPDPFEPPVFLIGCMRSGTTFLANFMAEHPQMLRLESELNEVWTQIGGIDCTGNREYADRQKVTATSAANMAAFFERCKLEFTQSKYYYWRWLNKLKRGTGGVKKSSEKLILLNKSVHMVNRIDYVMNMFASARVILIIRPIEQQVNSLKLHFEKNAKNGHYFKTPAGEKDSWISSSHKEPQMWNIEDLAQKWIQLNKVAIQDLHRNGAEHGLILDYEQMVNEPAAVLARIYAFLGLPPIDVNIENTLNDRKAFNTHTAGNPLEKWKSTLGEEGIAAIEKVKREMAEDFEYVESYRKANQ